MTATDHDRIVSTIEQAPLGTYLGRQGAEVLAGYAGEERALADGEFLFHRGDPPETFFLVTRGRLAVVREPSRQRSEVIVHVLEEGDLVGELSFIDGDDHTQSVRAIDGEAAVLAFELTDFEPLIEEHPRVMYDFMRAVIVRVHQTAASLGQQQQELTDYVSRGGKRL
ncbi:MAG TPA: cyclic nucleotide-binding domain-containing protein [Nocardioides sp.]|uniref:Crp/Fnr family transcriptional regulator n=1 Tax=Nocardioides sp. TaxID=35761 RepID=UPI002BA6C7FE|nr:cyclic nucleotide-binding domain-containing protein [Nocardioides sp.]HQR27429.1 cyclic nucleotide-binding domain-containing protein [Nocardioides sp.]